MLDPIDVRYFKMAVGADRIKHESGNDIQARCPICGDSKHSKSKARLHLYDKNGVTLVNCFNECPCVNKPVWKFLRDHYPTLLPSYNREKFSNKIDEIKNDVDLCDLVGELDVPSETATQFEKPSLLFDLSSKFENTTKSYEYIESRGLEWNPLLGDIYVSKKPLTIDGKFYNIKDFIIIPLYCGSKWYGFYSRSLTEHKFYTYIPEKNAGFKVWNMYNIDRTKPVYVFEGIFDALAAYNSGFTNVIACMGAKPPLDKLDGCKLVFALDNDTTGVKNAIKYAELGYDVVVYDNLYKDLNEMLINNMDITEILNKTYNGLSAIIRLQRKL